MTDDLRTRIVTALWGSWQPTNPSIESMADAVIEALDEEFADFGLWLAEEITGRTMTRINLESCLSDWKAGEGRR